jgi:hypothetical protein
LFVIHASCPLWAKAIQRRRYGTGGKMICPRCKNRKFREIDCGPDGAELFSSKIGKVIESLKIENDELCFTFENDTQPIKLYDAGQCCCESRYMHTDDDLEYYIGAKLQGAEIADGPEEEDGKWGETKESQFLKVETSKGVFTVVNYNEHNGYYGGFAVECAAINP